MHGSFLDGNGTVRCGNPYSIPTWTTLGCGSGVAERLSEVELH